MSNHAKIYKTILKLLENKRLRRGELVADASITLLGNRNIDRTPVGKQTEIKGNIGAVIDEMTDMGILSLSGDGFYTVAASKPVALRAESCEREILLLLRQGPLNRFQIRSSLEKSFGTDRTPSTKDDNILYSYVGQILKRLQNLGMLELIDGKYSIAKEKRARLDDIDDMLAVKGSFLTRLHAKGGEFFEHYFMTLLGKYLSKHGKQITENYTTGGSADGGIDGIIKTVDALGFRETIMVQTKNRLETTNETILRGFYGAVCAAKGSRGIFATSSDFHPTAKKFLDGIDNCVGVNGDKLFEMAAECLYGIKRRDGKYIVDTKIL